MKILITGNCGFIGQNFVRKYKNKYKIIGIDKIGYASDKKALYLCDTFIGNINNKTLIDRIFNTEKPDIVINFAAESHVDNSIKSPEIFMKSNFMGVFNLLECIKKHNIRFIQISTDECYGDLQLNDPPFFNINLLKPSSPYSASKASADLLILSYCKTFEINASIIRSCNNFGPFQYKEKFIPVVIINSIKNLPIPIYGSGKNIREWIYVDDNCEGINSVIKNGKSGQIYHLGSGQEFENIEIARIILKLMGRDKSLISMVDDRKGHDFRYSLNCDYSYKYLKWESKININDGLKKTISWYKKNINYWE